MPAVAPVTSAVLMPGTLGPLPRLGRCASPPGTSTPSAPASTASRPGCSGSDVDVLAMQETKCQDEQFPDDRLRPRSATRWPTTACRQWNGVAIALAGRARGRRRSASTACRRLRATRSASEARALGATCGGVRVWSLYVPNGRALDDPHLDYKLDWLARLRDHGRRLARAGPGRARSRWCGDWNIAPQDEDVWDMAYLRREDARLAARAGRLPGRRSTPASPTSSARTPPGPGVYTYWDYTQLRFPKRQGMRIDFVLGSPALAGRVDGAAIDREERKGKGASDHAPVIVDLVDA